METLQLPIMIVAPHGYRYVSIPYALLIIVYNF